jgi:death-on-curing protein
VPVDAIYLSRDDLLRLHDGLIRRYGGMQGVRDEGVLNSCLAQPKTFVFDVERFSMLIEKAAAYCFFIVRNHPFFDGNKRTGFVAALHFLRINNVKARFDEDEAYDVIVGVAKGEVTVDDLATMIALAVARAQSSPANGASKG